MNTASRHSNESDITPMSDKSFAKPAALATPMAIRWLALGAVAGPILFTLAWLALGVLSPGYTAWRTWLSPYSPISQPSSGLGMGITAPFMNTAFVFSGLLILACLAGIF